MSKNFYFFTIFFAVLTAICGAVQNTIALFIGFEVYNSQSFIPWFLATNFASTVGFVFILYYFYEKNYRFSFYSGLATSVCTVALSVILLMMLALRTMQNFYSPVLLAVLVSSVVYGVSLIIHPVRKFSWLKTAGSTLILFSSLWIIAVIWVAMRPEDQRHPAIEKFNEWASLIASLIPLLYAWHFYIELKSLKQSDIPPMNKLTESGFWLTAMVSILFTLTFGLMLTTEAAGRYSWEKSLSDQAKAWDKIFDSRTYEAKNGDVLKYQLLPPLNFDPQKKYPLVVCLPYGDGVKGSPAAQVLLQDFYREKYPSYLFVPYGRPGVGWGGVPNYPVVDQLVFDAIHALEHEVTAIDTTRRYVTGVSLGGYGSWHFITSRPNMFAAAIPVCGGGNPELGPKIKDVAVWAFHGAKDRNVPVSESRNIIDEMKKAGGNPQYTEYPEAAHNIWDNVAATPGLWDWLFSQSKKQQSF